MKLYILLIKRICRKKRLVCDWLMKIGGVVGLVGGVLFALGWQRDDAEGKSRGLMTLMAGFMLIAIAQAPDIFGL